MSLSRRWQLTPQSVVIPTIAADARLSQTNYLDDQSWRVALGEGDSAALALQSRLGGRAGLVSLVSMWEIDNRVLYLRPGFSRPPVIVAFAPALMTVEMEIVPGLAARAEFWVMDSHAVGCRWTLVNNSAQTLTVRGELFLHAGANQKEVPASLISAEGEPAALALAMIGNLHPVAIVEGGTPGSSPNRIGRALTLKPKGKASWRWVFAGRPTPEESLTTARKWLATSWTSALKRATQASEALPDIETEDEAMDLLIAFSYQQTMQSYLRPTASMPYASLVANRSDERGFSARGDGADHLRSWSGQMPHLAYLSALTAATIHPEFSEGLIRNYLAVQAPDGFIDLRPGLGGQRGHLLCTPLLARLSWSLFQYTENQSFLRDVFAPLLRFFERWMQPDFDIDADGVPEWQNELQTLYPYQPTFGVGRGWGQQADIRTVETPDLLAYLLSEALSLREMALTLGETAYDTLLNEHIAHLSERLAAFWHEDRFAYRDRDTHTTQPGERLLTGGPADEPHFLAAVLASPARLVVQIIGGLEHVPNANLKLTGLNAAGQTLEETLHAKDMIWISGRGVGTTTGVFRQLDQVTPSGLIRVYKLQIDALDTSRRDLNGLLPLWLPTLPAEQVAALVAQLRSDAAFSVPNGVTMTHRGDPTYNPAGGEGSGGVWPFWLTLIGEGLIEHGEPAFAAELLRRLMTAQVQVVRQQEAFSEFYHSDQPVGSGERGHLAGIVPLHLLQRVLGVRIRSARRVGVGGPFAWPSPVKVRQYGVTVERSADGTHIVFPSGSEQRLPADAPWTWVDDPQAPAPSPRKRQRTPSNG